MPDSLLVIVLLSIVVTYVWRAAGVALAERINPGGAIFEWIGCVAYAMLAGLMARVMIFPVGMLADTSLSVRAIAMVAGFTVFYSLNRHFIGGTLVAIVAFYSLIRLTNL